MEHYYDNIKLNPNELDKLSIKENIILDKLKNKIGNKCNKYGYIKKDSIKLINVSSPKIISSHFDGCLYYKLEYTADIINPMINSNIICKINKKNPYGILGYNNCIIIIISYKYNNNVNLAKKLDYLNINDKIEVKIVGKSFNIYDTQINVLGEFVKKID